MLRQEQLARNRKAEDDYWTHVRRGHGAFFRLERDPDSHILKCVIAPGTSKLRLAPVPNKADDLGNKIVEALMVDLPAPEPETETDSEEAERAAELAAEFLRQDGGEDGTRDAALFWRALDSAFTRCAAFLHPWIDQKGGGWIPLQIKAHPQAQDPSNPLIGPDGSPTTDPILRYVQSDESGAPIAFTDDPSQAGRQWVPKIRVDVLGREHVRLYPETADVADCEKAILLWYCTIGEARRRWPDTLGSLDDQAIGQLADWVPPRYLTLLPPALRSRWKLATGEQADPKGSANDERVLFFYCLYQKQTPDHPQGACVYVSGANGGTILGREPWTAMVPHPEGGQEPKRLDLPVIQVSLVLDADDKDPTGRPPIERIGGASEAYSTLGAAYLDAIDEILHPARYVPATSPVTADDIAQSRATGEPVEVLSSQDYPHIEEVRQLPPNFLNVQNALVEDMNSAIGSAKAAQGADNQQEVSGVARNIAVQQAKVSMGRSQQNAISAHERYWRVKLQLAMKGFDAPQLIRYSGEDGSYKVEWFTGADFSAVTGVKVAPGTGTMMPPEQKVSYVQMMQNAGYVSPDDAIDAAKPTFAQTLGLPDDPHQQRIERQVAVWLKGVPSPEWIPQYQQYQAEMQQYQQVQAAEQQAQDAHQQASQSAAANADVQPEAPPAPPMPVPPPQAPWTPFTPLPMDDEPAIAALRQRRLSKLMAGARFAAQPPEWQSVVFDAYNAMRQAVAASQMPVIPHGVTIAAKTDASSVGEAEQNAAHPGQPQKPQNPKSAPSQTPKAA